jgi:hypothetical protein
MRDLSLLFVIILALHGIALTVLAAAEEQGGSTGESTSSNNVPVLNGQRTVSVFCHRLHRCCEHCNPQHIFVLAVPGVLVMPRTFALSQPICSSCSAAGASCAAVETHNHVVCRI